MNRSPPKAVKSAEELRAELEWAVQVLTGDASADRVVFALPTPASDVDASEDFNWDVDVSCRPDQDEAVQAAIVHVAEKWNLAVAEGSRPASASIWAARSGGAAPAAAQPAAEHFANGSRRYDAPGPCRPIEFE